MSRLSEFLGWLGTVTYKPGFTFYAEPAHGKEWTVEYLNISLVGEVPDVNNPAAMVPVGFHTSVPFALLELGENHWRMAVDDVVYQLEMHEMEEWLKAGGERFNDPHPL